MKQSYARKLPAAWVRRAQVLAALGAEHRQRILLMFERGEALTISDIVAATPLSRTSVSHHIRVLVSAGVLRATKRGNAVYLVPNPKVVLDAMDGVTDYLREHHL